jgi:hypothetical protein
MGEENRRVGRDEVDERVLSQGETHPARRLSDIAKARPPLFHERLAVVFPYPWLRCGGLSCSLPAAHASLQKFRLKRFLRSSRL